MVEFKGPPYVMMDTVSKFCDIASVFITRRKNSEGEIIGMIILKNTVGFEARSRFAASKMVVGILCRAASRIKVSYPTNFQTDTMINEAIAESLCCSHCEVGNPSRESP